MRAQIHAREKEHGDDLLTRLLAGADAPERRLAGSPGAETRPHLRKLRTGICRHGIFRAQDLLGKVQARADSEKGPKNLA